MSDALSAEIFCLGNELLIGRTINKNATEIALILSKLGFKVTRITTVRDELEAASDALIEISNRNPDVICITGGLGPTFDDIQLDVVAKAFGLELILDENALQLIADRYKMTKDEVPKMIRKMAVIPINSMPLKNAEGTAPGVKLKINNQYIFCMPGVPSEMRSILNNEIIPLLRSDFELDKKMVEFGFNLRGVGESRIVEITEKIRKQFPDVNFKSHPRRNEKEYWLSLHTYLVTDNFEMVRQACETWKYALTSNFDIKTSKVKPIFDDNFEPE